uniref:Putative transcription factor GTE10 n=1 Tax=Davidia involucrata TaxID=16924 RepID=A0A5B6ZTT8_DAVIN
MAPTIPIRYIGQRETKTYLKKGLTQMMGKTRKFSRGHSSGFVPDYRHAVETMAESEGFGSSGRVDMEMTASEDSCAPKRKCISLNVDSYDRYGVPIQILSLSKMSQSERKDLELRLKSELEQVRILQKKIASLNSDVVVLSPSSDIRSCSDGLKRPPLESSRRSIEVPAVQGKKRAPPGRNGPRTKRATAGRIESVKQVVPPSTSNAMLMKQCETLLNRLMSHQFGWVFNTPVDVVKLNIPDYFNVIKHPMDLGTVKSKLLSGEYLSPLGFAADVRLAFSNAMTYNPSGNDVHIMAETLSKYFEVRWKPIEKKLPVTTEAPAPSRSSVHVETETGNQMPPLKKKKIASVDKKVKQEPVKRVMSDVEKHKLSTELEALLAELPESIIDFLKEQSFNASQTGEDEIEIDIDALSDDTLFKLRKLLDDYLLDKQKRQGKAEPCEMELHNESGFSNSLVQLCKAKDPIDEDVDIGGNDPPILSCPPVEIEKDLALRNSKCSGSSSSSSESGSSSSDSDSGSSSGGESDSGKASVPANTAKETLISGTNLVQKTSILGDQDSGNNMLNGLFQVEQNSQSKTVAIEANYHPEGESAPSERQVSPEKHYRRALLRSRFADTILKAQEKTLEKGEKQDPEKLRLEKEELERRRKEEKARLQAEAKAAEEAQRKAEAEAAAEARRKRELEREAARQALQMMEKTVDINENCQFLEDLEMLRAVPDEHLQSLIDETSPDHSQNGLGSFKLQGSSNPLEQLGLYMKVDEEEEEGEPQSIPDAVNDAEEGEID